MPAPNTVPFAALCVNVPVRSMARFGWTCQVPLAVMATWSPFAASETLGTTTKSSYVCVSLSASAVAGTSSEETSVNKMMTARDAFIVLSYCLIVMRPALSGAIALLRSGNATTLPSSVTSRRCVATPAPPAVCSEVNGTFGTVAVRMSPDSRDLPTTWIVAVPLKLATPPEIVTGPVTVPWTRICAMLAQGPNENPPDRPAITHRNSPPDDDAVNPSCDVVPRSPSTMPPPLTLGSDAYALVCEARIVLIAKHKPKTTRRQICFTNTSPSARADLPAGGIALGQNATRSPRGYS